jgi:alkaline phosphatase
MENSMKIGIIADLHLPKKEFPPRPEPGKKPEPLPDDPVTAGVKAFYEKAKQEKYDFVINLGDLINGTDNEDDDYMTAMMFSRSMISSTVNTYYVLGNRDAMCLPKDLLLHCNKNLGGAYSFLKDGVLFIALDANYSCDGKSYETGFSDWTDSLIPAAQIEFLKNQLERTDFEKAVILCHQRLDLFMDGLEHVNPHVVSNAEEIRHILEQSGKVALVLQAHYHSGDDTVQNGIRYYTQKAFFKNLSYSVLTASSDGFTIEKEEI